MKVLVATEKPFAAAAVEGIKKEIESELNDARFLRCHQSYLVNMNYVSEANDSFVLQNGDMVLIRAKSKRMILQKVLEYKEKTYRMRDYLSKHSMV